MLELKKLYIKADVFKLVFMTNCDLAINYIKNNISKFKKVTINFEVIDETDDVSFCICYLDDNEYFFDLVSKNKLLIKFLWSSNNDISILPIIFRQSVELLRQRCKEIKLHSSAVEINNKIALMLAPSEGGKTTTAMALCQKYNYSFFANDATVVQLQGNKIYALRGDNEIKARMNSLKAYSKKYYEKCNDDLINKELWYSKVTIDPQNININLADSTYEVSYVFFVKIDTTIEECSLICYDVDNSYSKWLKPKMLILQNINGTIRGDDLVPYGNDGKLLKLVIPDLDTTQFYLNRIELVNKIFENCKVYQLRGPLDKIAEKMNDIIGGKIYD